MQHVRSRPLITSSSNVKIVTILSLKDFPGQLDFFQIPTSIVNLHKQSSFALDGRVHSARP